MIIVVYKHETNEIIAVIDTASEDNCIIHKEFNVRGFNNGTEPIFTETNHGILLKENAFLMKGVGKNEG